VAQQLLDGLGHVPVAQVPGLDAPSVHRPVVLLAFFTTCAFWTAWNRSSSASALPAVSRAERCCSNSTSCFTTASSHDLTTPSAALLAYSSTEPPKSSKQR